MVVLDNIRSLYNTGAFFRTADGCGVERLVLCGLTPRPDQGARQRRAIAKTALGAELSVPWEYQASTAAAVAACADRGYHIVAIETSPAAVELFDWTPQWPVCLVFGHEKDGVSSLLESMSGRTIRARIWRAITEGGAADRTVAEHEAICDAIERRSPELARAWMTVHVASVEAWLRHAIEARDASEEDGSVATAAGGG